LGLFTLTLLLALPVSAVAQPTEHDDACMHFTLVKEADALVTTNPNDAIVKYQAAWDSAPSAHTIASKLAAAYEKQEDWAKVDAVLAGACKVAPGFASYFRRRGIARLELALHGNGSFDDARKMFDEAVRLDPNDAEAQSKIGELLERQGDDAGALARYTTAAKLAPTKVALFVPLAALYLRLDYAERAAQVADVGLSFGGDTQVRFALLHTWALALDEKHDAHAIEKYEQAYAACGDCTAPGQAVIRYDLGAAYANAKPPRKNEAISMLQSFIKRICKGGAAARYADPCSSATDLLHRVTQ
jgi:tetratricopeptide (TPR) repeat protein